MANKNLKKLIIGGVAAVAVGGSIALGAVTVASADSSTSPSSPSASSSTDTRKQPTSPSSTGTTDKGARGGGAGASQDTPVTGDEATLVSAAVTAKDSTVTVTSVRKDPDGSYDVLGTKDGANVMFDVSADLATITQAQGGKGGGKGGGGSQDTVITGDEATKVTAAVTAKDSAVTVSQVRKDPDGSYDVVGTKDGAKVFYEVSADLATVTARS